MNAESKSAGDLRLGLAHRLIGGLFFTSGLGMLAFMSGSVSGIADVFRLAAELRARGDFSLLVLLSGDLVLMAIGIALVFVKSPRRSLWWCSAGVVLGFVVWDLIVLDPSWRLRAATLTIHSVLLLLSITLAGWKWRRG